jgi:hypothetical protein
MAILSVCLFVHVCVCVCMYEYMCVYVSMYVRMYLCLLVVCKYSYLNFQNKSPKFTEPSNMGMLP